MNNLEKAYDMWTNLDIKCPSGMSKSQFLKKLVRDGDEVGVNSILNSINVCIKTVEDTEKFEFVKACISAVVVNLDILQDDIQNLIPFVQSLLLGDSVDIIFDNIIDMLALGQVAVNPAVGFNQSDFGVEFITASIVSKTFEVSEDAIILKPVNKQLDLLQLSNSEFHTRVRDFVSLDKNVKTRPLLILDRDKDIVNPYVKSAGRGYKFAYKGLSIPVKLV